MLLGKFPEDLVKELEARPHPAGTAAIKPACRSILIRRRPDIREAEWQLAGATARISVATANLFPRVAITAGAGGQGQGLGVTPVINQSIWSAGVIATVPLLDFGTLDALVNVADLRTRELLINYKRTVLNAVQEWTTPLAAMRRSRIASGIWAMHWAPVNAP